MIIPTADQIALAIVEAAKVYGDDPLAIARGGGGNRGRVLAYVALTEAFPDVTKAKISRWCAFPAQSSASAHLIHARKAKWWNEDAIDEVVGALFAPEYEPQDLPHFEVGERQLIARMHAGGADASAIAAALGASAGEVRLWLEHHGGKS